MAYIDVSELLGGRGHMAQVLRGKQFFCGPNDSTSGLRTILMVGHELLARAYKKHAM